MRSENFQKTSGSKGASPSIQRVTHPREEPTQSTWSERGREGGGQPSSVGGDVHGWCPSHKDRKKELARELSKPRHWLEVPTETREGHLLLD